MKRENKNLFESMKELKGDQLAIDAIGSAFKIAVGKTLMGEDDL